MAVGYDDGASTLPVRNSWGPSWGNTGYFRMPYAYLTGPGAGTEDTEQVDGAYFGQRPLGHPTRELTPLPPAGSMSAG